MGDWSGSSDDASAKALSASLAAGVNFYDSAAAYGGGRSDALLGGLVAAHRSAGIVTAGKVPPKNLQWPARASDALSDAFPLEHVLTVGEESRRRMNVDTMDLLQLHVWDDAWVRDPLFARAATEVKKRKIARMFGLSLNRWEPWNGLKAIETGLVDTVQVIYNIFDQAPEDALFPICVDRGIGVIARVPLDEGSLSGKMTLQTRFPSDDWRSGYFGPENLPETIRRVEALKEIVPAGMTLPEMALRFVLHHPAVSTIVVGMRDAAHITANTSVSDGKALDQTTLRELRKHRWDRKPAPWSD